MTDLSSLSIADAAGLVEKKEVSPVELAQASFARIDALNPKLNAFVTLAEADALNAAREAEAEIAKGVYRGKLHGIPIGHKDLFLTKGVRTTAGSELHSDLTPDYNAFSVDCYQEAGAIVLGKTNTHEFAYGPTGEVSLFGPVKNPWNTDHISGGSSSGSGAAVSAGLCFAATGSDTGGSIRIPSACCGVVGLKPTYGLVSRQGVFPLCWSMDTVGPLARTVEDAALMLQPIARHDPNDGASANRAPADYLSDLKAGVRGLRIGVPRAYFYDRAQKEIRDCVLKAVDELENLGARVSEVEIPYIENAAGAALAIYLAEATAYHEEDITQNPSKYSDQVLGFLELGNFLLAKDYLHAQRYRTLLGQSFQNAFESFDVLITPSVPIAAPRLGQETIDINGEEDGVFGALLRNTEPFNLTGLPCLVMPCGLSNEGLPISMQITGNAFAETTVLRVGQTYEDAAGTRALRPPLQ